MLQLALAERKILKVVPNVPEYFTVSKFIKASLMKIKGISKVSEP